ncbi:hypothetical protein OC844_004766 [Tilletia horrida]|nr:hypothetical protein OC844_004766 [Tilletia horrida]
MALFALRSGRVRLLATVAAGSLFVLVCLVFFTTSAHDAAFSASARLRQHLPSWVLPQPAQGAGAITGTSTSTGVSAAAPIKPSAAPASAPTAFHIPTGPGVKVPGWLLPPEEKPEEPDVLVFPPNPTNLAALLPARFPASPQLQTRLQAFLDAPAPSRRTAYMQNLLSCSRSIFQADDDQAHVNHAFWLDDRQAGTDALRLWRSRLVRSLEQAQRRGEALVAESGDPLEGTKGVVYAPRTPQDAEDVLRSLRWLRSYLKSPIKAEVWYSAAPSSHLNLAEARFKPQLDALTVLQAHVRALPPHVHARTGMTNRPPHIRAAAMVASSFTKVLYLEGTSLPLQDPLSLFTSSAFLKGYPNPASPPAAAAKASSASSSAATTTSPLYTPNAVLWPSIHRDSNENPIWRFVGQPCVSDHWQIDAGQMLVDKRGNGGLNLAALHIAAYMQDVSAPSASSSAAPAAAVDSAVTVEAQLDGRGGAEFFARLSADGQEALRYAFMVLGLNYTSAPLWPSFAGNLVREGPAEPQPRFCGHALVQYDLETEPYTPPPSAAKSWLVRGPVGAGKGREKNAQPLFLHLNLTSAFLAAHPNLPRGELFTHIQSFAPNKLGDRAFEEVSAGVFVVGGAGTGAGAGAGAAKEGAYACLRMKPHIDPYTKLLDEERRKTGLPPAAIQLESVELLKSGKGWGGGAGAASWARVESWISAYWSASAGVPRGRRRAEDGRSVRGYSTMRRSRGRR